MEGILAKQYVRYQVLSPTLPDEDDLILKFETMASKVRPSNDCANAILIECTEQGTDDIIQSATLIWKNCASKQFIDIEEDDIETVNGKLMSITVNIDDVIQSPQNDFELEIDTASGTYIAARGRIYL